MTSDGEREAFVWIWLPDETGPVMAGRLEADGDRVLFSYDKSYLERIGDRPPAIPLYEPELPLRAGTLPPPDGLAMPGCIRDAAPDAWGRRVIVNAWLDRGADTDTAILDEPAYLLASGSDRIGALDFQRSPTEYAPRVFDGAVDLEALARSVGRVEEGVPLDPEPDRALILGCAVGGARPKALVEDGKGKYIAKFSSGTDLSNVVKAEFVAMRLARLAGLNVASVKLATAADKDVLLVERFDRRPIHGGWSRKGMVSVLTLFGLDGMTARYASYETLAGIVRRRFADPKVTLRELFSRLVFNILCGNTDDHARNHAAFWDGEKLTLTPAYDICPQGRTDDEASQAMLISGNDNLSRLGTCLGAAHNFLLSENDARAVFSRLIESIETHWDAVCDEAELDAVARNLLWGRQFMNPFSIRI